MSGERLLLDTAYIHALLNPHDDYHEKARSLVQRSRAAREVWITEAVLIEVGNSFSTFQRTDAVQFIQQCYAAKNMQVVSVDTRLLLRALQLYQARPDKTWGLTDCISFTVMRDQGLQAALTADRHFVQAGYQALLLESP